VKPYSLDLRERVLDALDAGDSSTKVAERFAVSGSFVRKMRARRETLGHVRPDRFGGRKRLLNAKQEEQLCLLALAHADATLAELQVLAKAAMRIRISITIIGRRLNEMGLTRKKSPSGQWRWTAPMSKSRAAGSGENVHSAAPHG
jgi:transposase